MCWRIFYWGWGTFAIGILLAMWLLSCFVSSICGIESSILKDYDMLLLS